MPEVPHDHSFREPLIRAARHAPWKSSRAPSLVAPRPSASMK